MGSPKIVNPKITILEPQRGKMRKLSPHTITVHCDSFRLQTHQKSTTDIKAIVLLAAFWQPQFESSFANPVPIALIHCFLSDLHFSSLTVILLFTDNFPFQIIWTKHEHDQWLHYTKYLKTPAVNDIKPTQVNLTCHGQKVNKWQHFQFWLNFTFEPTLKYRISELS